MTAAALASFSKWLAATPLSHAIQTTAGVIPTLQTIHILSVAILFSSAVLLDLRVLRVLQRDVPLAEAARRFLPVIWPVLLILLLSGSLLIIGEPRRSLLNLTFYVKMSLLLLAILLTAGLQLLLRPAPSPAEGGARHPLAAGLIAAASLLVWSGIIIAGRWIAYTET
jgi:hypothetical protein